MQPEPNPILTASSLSAIGDWRLTLTPDARAWLLKHRPGLAGVLAGHNIPPQALLTRAERDPIPSITSVPLVPSVPSPAPPRPGLGDRLAALLHRLGITAAVSLLQRRGLLPYHCGCSSRQTHLNALTPRLTCLLQPWPLTIATLFAWALLLFLLLRL